MKKTIYFIMLFCIFITNAKSNTRRIFLDNTCELEITVVNTPPLEKNQIIKIINTSPNDPAIAYYKWQFPVLNASGDPSADPIILKDTILPVEDTLYLSFPFGGPFEVILTAYSEEDEIICAVKSPLDIEDSGLCGTTSPVCEYVCNGDFEGLDYLPTNISQYFSHVDGSGILNIYYWDAVCNSAWVNHGGTTDIFTNNSNWDGMGVSGCPLANPITVPTNFAGTQTPYSGNNYLGIIPYTSNIPDYREYVLQRLNAPLSPGQAYQVSFAVSLASNSTLAIDKIDVAFGHGPIIDPCGNPSTSLNQFSLMDTYNHTGRVLANNPVSGMPAQIIPDITNPLGFLNAPGTWVVISGTYIATGDEKQIAIGNFYVDGQTATQSISGTPCLQGEAYYYIDKVSVAHILQPIDLNASSISICPGQSVTLSANAGFNNYSWSTGQSGATLNSIVVNPTATTTYTVTVFDPVCGSNVSESITVTVLPVPLADAGPDVSICGYGCANFDGSGGVSYLWSPPIGLNDPTLENPEICGPNVSSTYTVTVTDANGCQNTDNVNVTFTTANFPPPVITGPDNLCCATLTYSVPAGFDFYEWILPNGITIASSNSTGNVITLNPVGSGGAFGGEQICVQVTDPQGCVGQSCIILVACCGPFEPSSTTVTDGCTYSLLSDLIANNGWSNSYVSQTLHIQNDLILDANLTLVNCTVLVDVDRKILVEPNVTFTVNRTVMINSCDAMWEGIVLENDLCSLQVISNSFVSQAKNAVVSNSGGKFTLLTSTFRNNFRNVVINPYASVHLGQIHDCKIDGTNFGMLAPHNTEIHPFSGVEINKVREVTIGSATNAAYTNEFEKMRYGIISIGTNLNVYNNEFKNISIPSIPLQNQTSNNNSIAIWARDGYAGSFIRFLNVGNSGIPQNKFEKCRKGVQSEGNLSTSVLFNTFKDIVITNVFCNRTSGNSININNNTISGEFGVGILCVDMKHSQVNIVDNLIDEKNSYNHAASYLNAGIHLANVFPTPANYTVSDNLIYRCENGIIGIGVPNIIIKNNTVLYQRNNSQIIGTGRVHTGIQLRNSERAEVSLNTISRTNPNPINNGTLALTDYLRGISVEISQQSYVHDNHVHQMGYGMYWRGSSLASTIACNNMEKCWNGVYFDLAEIGHQGSPTNPSGNYWVQNQDATGKMTGSINNISIPITNWYADLSSLITNPNVHSVPLNQISILNATGNANCQIAPGGISPGPIDPQKREAMFGSIVRDEKQFLVFNDETRQLNRRYLYQSLKNNPGWISLGGTDDADYQSFFNTVSMENDGVMEDVTALIADTNYVAANALNQTINPNILPETNHKTVSEIYLATWANSIEIDTNQFMILEGIACQDPIEGGPAVYGARILIGLDYECSNGANRISFEDSQEMLELVEDRLFDLFPNPSNGSFTLSNNGVELLSGSLQVFDLTGKIVFTSPVLNEIESRFDLTHLPAGMYHYLIYNEGISVFSDKFVISR